MPYTYSILILDPAAENRSRLKNAASAIGIFSPAKVAESLLEGDNKLCAASYDIIFISSRLDDKETAQFIGRWKQAPHGRDAAYVKVCHGESNRDDVAQLLIDGADGILLEPFSAEALIEIVYLAERVKQERQQVRTKAALHLLVREISDQLHQLTQLEKHGRAANISRAVMHEMCGVLRELEPDAKELYYQILFEVFSQSTPQKKAERAHPSYRGVSQRVRRRLSERTMEVVKAALAA